MKYVDKVLTELKEKNADQPEFIEAATNILKSLEPVIEAGTLTVAEPLILKNVDYNVIFLSNF